MPILSGANPIKKFKAVIYGFLELDRVFVPGKPFQPSLMFVGKARGLPKSGVPKRCFTFLGSILTHKH